MMPENATYAYVGALVDELVRLGVEHLCLCPGSRSTPVALSAARHPGMRIWTLIDERSAAFFALGMARGLRGPVALLSTSGTAAANFLPAVVEARYSRVPLIVLTADRPHELRESGASQAIDQVRLYGTHVKWFLDLALPEASDGALRYVRTVTGQAVAIAADAPSGPVHLNVPLREPLVPIAEAGGLPPDRRSGPAWEGREAGRPYAAWSSGLRALQPDLIKELAALLGARPRGVIVCGPSDDPVLPGAVSRLAAALGYPVLADPLSQVRCGPHDRHFVIDAYDPVLRSPGVAARLAPQAVVRFGGVPASKPLLQYLEMHDAAHQVVIDAGGGWHDPMRLAARFVHADPSLLCQALAAALPTTAPGNAAWAETWRRLSGLARGVLQECLEHVAEPFEGRVFSELATLLPEGAVLYVGNSMPVRDLDSFFPGSPRAIRVLGNRGASGIDGLVSSALGVAASGASPVVLVVGDLAFYHDMNGLLAAKLHRLRATIVLINNDGGGIFSFLPQADYPEHFEALFGTPHGLEFRRAAELYGAAFARADTWEAFRAQVRQALGAGGLSIVEVRTRRDRNVILHREMWAAVDAAIRGALSAPAV
ncbi:MAG: 2-succinyl-5-enolpyruvyl-6-hydroxy-3-cyclohexene-1-carboxylic-acid synthase, partial [Armatimonadota bacterium]|nr:2-succinyl-5-enolpyruvyl-6-hydroxy-3-cyclohexene-1-carboxylic-acid synthase [Armatimonadota bacterium]